MRTRTSLPTKRAKSSGLRSGRFTPGADTDQYLHPHNLEQIHRHTLALLRREVQPVPRAVYADFLSRWQHLHVSSRLAGREGLLTLMQQLRALPVPGRAWERDVLALRLERYDKVNALGIGPQGFGGRVTALAVHVETFPAHIASLPVGVNLQCHAARHKEAVL